ncbi:MAG: DUF2007 domain-containing protein [Pseudomonadota bacterium]
MKESFTIIRTYNYLPEAQIAKGHLESEGISAWLDNENVATINWAYASMDGGIKLRVETKDAERAHKILEEPQKKAFKSTVGKVAFIIAGLLLLSMFVAFTMAFFDH